MFSLFKLSLFLLIVLLVAGCATDRTVGGASDVTIADLDSLPAPGEEVFFKIGPQQLLEIQVVGAEDLSGTFLTDGNGNLTFPFLGELQTNGKAPAHVSQLIADGLRDRYVLNPQVRIFFEEAILPTLTVGGEVNRPGTYPALNNTTLLSAINSAEGPDEFAKLDDVLVMRTVDGQNYIGVYNLKAIQRGNYLDPRLYPNDVVMVGDSPARRRLAVILQFVPVLSTSAILIDRLGN